MGQFKTLFITVVSGLTLAGCKAAAEDKPTPETANVTREDCLEMLPDKVRLKECIEKLRIQNQAEITARVEALRKEKAIGEKLDKTIEVLTDVKELTVHEEPSR